MTAWFVTGGSRGLGRAIVEAALARGDRVAATSRNPAQLDALAGDALLPVELDATDSAEVERAFAEAVERFGRIDAVVNNAGYVHVGAIEEPTDDEARAQLETMLLAPFYVTRAAVRHMRERSGGTIVQISSLAAVGGLPGHSLRGREVGARRDERGGARRAGPVRHPDRPRRARRLSHVAARERDDVGAPSGLRRDPRDRAPALRLAEPAEAPAARPAAYERGTQIWRERLAEAEAHEHLSRSTSFA